MPRVVKIRYFEKMPVYNMEVDENHNFITARGTVLHNCDALRYFAISRTLPTQLAEPDDGFEDEPIEDYDDYMTGGEVSQAYLTY